jgi:DUF1365 family protein
MNPDNLASPLKARLLRGQVMHRRLRPVQHAFRYGVFYLRLPLSQLHDPQHAPGNALFSVNRFNLISLHARDHGARDGSPLLPWIRALLQREGLGVADGEVWLQCFPRVLGYVFNPVSFWFCHDQAGQLRAVLAEVSNTFGEHHSYLLAHPDNAPIADGDLLQTRKVFHVSPFFAIEGGYRFVFHGTGEDDNETPTNHLARIDYHDAEGALLLTSISGRTQTLNAGSVLWAALTHPLMTWGVMLRIHWQALRLWLKRVPFYRKPAPPDQALTR